MDITNEMIALTNSAKRSAGLTNVEFRPGDMEKVPLADGSVDVVIDNCDSNLSQDKQAVFYCKVGGRSAEVLAVAKGAGFADAVHVGGGVAAWVNQVDPSQPAY